MGCGVPWHRWHCLCCLPKRGKGTWLGWAWAWGLLNDHRGCSRQGLTPRADQDMEGVIVSFCLISRGNKPNAVILPGIINFSRNPQKSVSSEVEGNWVEMGGQMEIWGEFSLGIRRLRNPLGMLQKHSWILHHLGFQWTARSQSIQNGAC